MGGSRETGCGGNAPPFEFLKNVMKKAKTDEKKEKEGSSYKLIYLNLCDFYVYIHIHCIYIT